MKFLNKITVSLINSTKITPLHDYKTYFTAFLVSISILGSACTAEDPAVVLTINSEINQAVFSSPEIATQALILVLTDRNKDKLIQILGPNAKELFPLHLIDTKTIEKYLAAYAQAHRIRATDDKATLIVGQDGWTLPIPLTRDKQGWHFDTQAGVDNVRIRRIGRNELAVIQTVIAYHDAQLEYASVDRNGDGYLEYAQYLMSKPGQRDGLYWEASIDADQSPLGSLLSSETQEGAYHGYFYRIIKSQGATASGGLQDYIVDNRMTSGFALLAMPAIYGQTGVMSFIINHSGIVYQQDMGQNTKELGFNMENFDPGQTWEPVKVVSSSEDK